MDEQVVALVMLLVMVMPLVLAAAVVVEPTVVQQVVAEPTYLVLGPHPSMSCSSTALASIRLEVQRYSRHVRESLLS